MTTALTLTAAQILALRILRQGPITRIAQANNPYDGTISAPTFSVLRRLGLADVDFEAVLGPEDRRIALLTEAGKAVVLP
jgi:hypothetical protein